MTNSQQRGKGENIRVTVAQHVSKLARDHNWMGSSELQPSTPEGFSFEPTAFLKRRNSTQPLWSGAR